jgi:hypothetical protein
MGVTEESKGIDQTLKDLKLTNEVSISFKDELRLPSASAHVPKYYLLVQQEVDKFAKAFKDPEFIKLFEDYAKEVSDPKARFMRMSVNSTSALHCLLAYSSTCLVYPEVEFPETHGKERDGRCHPNMPAQVKAETDMYLRQLEMEGRVEEVLPK